ncbi:hypothetical protein [Aeromicrobium sp. CTD01-1L150]|uniref:hypothetical protein n=1 Tax=Aeromicrobium sp. CTD01-1L150 TaxID=3341830 RepID=UPI0035C25EC8
MPVIDTIPTATCPSWCTDHDYADHPDDEKHLAHFGFGQGADECDIQFAEWVTDSERELAAHVSLEGTVTPRFLRQLAAALTEAADTAETVTGGTA